MPQHKSKEIFVSRKADSLKDLVLTDSQNEAVRKIKEQLNNEGVASLTGYAGTGKTTLMKYMIEDMAAYVNNVYLMAPTHKAANVLSAKTARDVRTVHSSFGLRPQWDGRGGYKFVRSSEEPQKFVPRSMIVVDEASMINKQLYDLLIDAQERYNLKLLFVGDPAQLPPVNEKPSLALSHDGYMLTEVIRQTDENPIVPLSMKVRAKNGRKLKFEHSVKENGEGVHVYDDQEQFIIKAIERFQTEDFKTASDTCRILAYRNDVVDTYNDIIRHSIYENAEREYIKGEWLFAKEPWYDPEAPLYEGPVIQNSEEFYIHSVQPNHAFGYKTWLIMILSAPNDPIDTARYIEVLRDESKEKFQKNLDKLMKSARKHKWKWKKYYELKETFANVDYAYAMTTHRAQGSTFGSAFIDVRDMRACRKKKEQQSLMYVGVTRPASELHVLT